MLVLVELTPLDSAGGTRPPLRAASADDRAITSLNGVRWWPAIKETPVLTMRLFDGDFSDDTDTGTASLTILTDKLARLDANARRYLWAGAGMKIYAGNSGDAWPWTQWFEGKVDSFEAQANRLKLTAKVNIEPFQKNALTANYAGTGGIEGGADLKGKPKPWLFGRALNAEPVLIDSVNSVYQFSAYGPVQAINTLYERASDFGASVGDFATYAALVAATIVPGRWGTCLASGLIRLGAPAFGVITGDVDGDKPSTWLRKTGEIINRIATNAGISGTLIDSASLTALDTALPYNINLYLTEQTSVLDIARRLARPCNAQAGVSWLGKLFVTRVAIGTPALTLDAQGRRKPGVQSSVESDVSPPYWRLEMGAQRSWRVHTFDEIATFAPLVNRGAYSASAWYREGNIVTDQGTSWLYTSTTPGSGSAPPTLPTTSNSQWTVMSDPGSAIVVTPSASDFRTTDNAYNPSSQTITFSAALYNLSGTVSWTAKNPTGTTVKSGTGTSFSVSQSDMGTNLSLVVTATCGWASSQPVTIGVVDDSTAAVGATNDLKLTSIGSQAVTINANTFLKTVAVDSHQACVRGEPQDRAIYAEVDIVPGAYYTTVMLDDDATSAPSGTNMNLHVAYNAATGELAILRNASTVLATTIATNLTGKLAAAYDSVRYRVWVGGVERIPSSGMTESAGLRIWPKWTAFSSGSPLITGLRVTPYTDNDFATTGGATKPEDNADVTSGIIGVATVAIDTSYTGTIKTGQLTKSIPYKLVRNGVDITSGVTWTYTVISGTINGFTNASGAQAISGAGAITFDIASFTSADAVVELKAVYGTATRTFKLKIDKNPDSPPVGGTGGSGNPGTSASTGAISDTTAATYSGAQTSILSVVAGTGGRVDLAAPLQFSRTTNGTSDAYGKWQWRVVGGVLADVATEIMSTASTSRSGGVTTDLGYIEVTMAKTGLTSGTTYEFQLLLRGSVAATLSYSGPASATGS